MANNAAANVDAEAEAAKYWDKICAEGTDIIEEYFDKMDFRSVLIIDYTELSSKFISVLAGKRINVYLCVDKIPEGGLDTPESVKVGTNAKNILKDNEINLIIDSDAKKYHIRRYTYDGHNVESCLLWQVLEKVVCDEFFYLRRFTSVCWD